MDLIALPRRKELQSLDRYVLVHLRVLEAELLSGVPYRALVNAMKVAGFETPTLRSIRSAVYRARKKRPSERASAALPVSVPTFASPPRPLSEFLPEAKSDGAVVGRLFRELARPPAIRGESSDLLI